MNSYDEDLNENRFLISLRCNHYPILKQAITEGWVICVPCQRSLKADEFTEDEIFSNVLAPSNDISKREYRTLAGQMVLKDGFNLHLTTSGSVSKILAGILFHEEFHCDGGSKYNVWCISRSLGSIDSDDVTLESEDDNANLSSVQDCFAYLKRRVAEKGLGKIDVAITKVTKILCEAPSVMAISFKVESVYQEALSCLENPDNCDFIMSSAIESYVLHEIYKPVMEAIRRATAKDDAELNKRRREIIRHLNYPEDFHVRDELIPVLSRVRRELEKLPMYRSTLEKLECLSRTMRIATDHAATFGIMTTTDDFLPILICGIISDQRNASWYAELCFLKNFRLSVNDRDERAYYIASLEAALEHLKTAKFSLIWFRPSFHESFHEPYLVYAEQLWSAVESNDCSKIDLIAAEVRRSGARLGNRLCHPLCSCLECADIKRMEADSAGGLINCGDDRGITPLHVAAASGHPRVIEHLLSRGARVNISDCVEYRTPLHIAAYGGHTDAVLLLLYAGADVNSRDVSGRVCLHLAALAGHKNCVNALLYFAAHSGLDVDSCDSNGDSALHMAALWGFNDVAAALLDHKANPTKRNFRGETPIDLAANPVVGDLLKSKRDGDQNGKSSFVFSPKRSKWSSIFVRKKDKDGLDAGSDPRLEKCFRAITLGDVRLACFYMGIDPFESGGSHKQKCHPLCECKTCSANEDSEFLSIDCHNEDGYTPLHLAALHNRIEIVKALLVNDADPNKTTARGMTPLHLACQCNLVDVAKMLLAFQADLSVRDQAGNSALHYACILGNVELTRILLAFGAADSGVNTNKRTPSMEAKERKFFDILRLFASS
ncbi:unnamed protein product [Notodromas monacha]|uniref:VPS9 domain-containing protein n=1 Tax=Notodromas monacha TaxID=399045 RepID=A0A7R9GC87_9CRUS|nr:unnamed protein product [Notodromas monacha]CAG0915566.1 unnamed protein product [Notodromas monacha]